jgi:hypothetical protein
VTRQSSALVTLAMYFGILQLSENPKEIYDDNIEYATSARKYMSHEKCDLLGFLVVRLGVRPLASYIPPRQWFILVVATDRFLPIVCLTR